MPSKRPVSDSLADIIENADRIEQYIAGVDYESFKANGLLRDAVERCLERVCEAAHRLGDQAAQLMPTQPWADIRAMGNILRHAYDKISVNIVWGAARNDVTSLASEARRVLAEIQLTGHPSN